MYQSHVVHLSINRKVDAVYAFLAEPWNYPKWASIAAPTYHQVGPHEWAAEFEFGERIVRFCERNMLGVLDHAVYRPGDQPIMMPMRVAANGEGCDLIFTFFRRPGVSEEEFASAIEWVTTDLLLLKGVLEV